MPLQTVERGRNGIYGFTNTVINVHPLELYLSSLSHVVKEAEAQWSYDGINRFVCKTDAVYVYDKSQIIKSNTYYQENKYITFILIGFTIKCTMILGVKLSFLPQKLSILSKCTILPLWINSLVR